MTELAVVLVPTWTLGDRLRKAREHAGLEQGELAARIGVSRGTVSNYELNHGTRPRKPVVLRAWADQCHVPLHWLETGHSPHPAGPDGGCGECAIRDSNPEPAGSVGKRWFGRTSERRGFMPIADPARAPHPRRRVVMPLAADASGGYMPVAGQLGTISTFPLCATLDTLELEHGGEAAA